ncbi:MAG: hypothetical protein R2705_04425 [Ilumatobacteraceae bacterium]
MDSEPDDIATVERTDLADAEPTDTEVEVTGTETVAAIDLDGIATDLADVEVALARLASGSYFTDESTGEPLPDDLLVARLTARRLASG